MTATTITEITEITDLVDLDPALAEGQGTYGYTEEADHGEH